MKTSLTFFPVLLLLASAATTTHALSSHSYTIAVDTAANGGGSVGSASYNISALAGQPMVIGPVSSAGYTLSGGFYYIKALEELLRKKATCLVFDTAALYAGFDGEGIWKSADNGETWTAAAAQPADKHVRGLVIHPSTRSTLYAGTYGGGMYTSEDSGDAWSACANTGLTNPNAVSLAIDPSGILYAGTEGGIFTSADCSTWSAVNTGLTVDAATPPVAIAIDPTTPATLYAGLDGAGVWKSADSGGSWSAATTQPTNNRIKALVIEPGDSTMLFAATYGGGVFTSADSGDNWAACANTNLANQNVISLVSDASGKLYAGTEAGVFVSADGCATWTAMNSGLP
jgi:ligand-binding sensor domain-containing protein